ncbi:MMPL family transporter [bacterium]|nr:MMPL family transporter [bacterium]
MLEKISRFSCRFPWLIFIVVGAISILMVEQIREKAYFEADLVKFLPTDMPAVKSYDYSMKNFNTQDTVLIGFEKKDGSILDADALRVMEKVVLELKELKASKTFESKLKGETVTLEQTVGIDPDSITSVANLEDAILDEETGSVITGSVIKNLKKEENIPSNPGEEELLPESDDDLQKIIPALKSRILSDRTFRGNILSDDLKSATIRASTYRKQVYKRRYAILELSTAIDDSRLTRRFQGKDSTFPFEIYGKTVNKTLIDENYIKNHTVAVRTQLHKYLQKELEDTFEQEPDLKELLDGDLTVDKFQSIMQHIERNDFFMSPQVGTWRSFMDSLYEFTLAVIDPFSLENLEFQIHDVKDMIDMAEVYYLTTDLLEKYKSEGITSYVAGGPIVIGVMSQMMTGDMSKLVPIAIGVVLLILVLSFKSVRGVFIPLVTVVLAVIWTLGLMAFLRIPFTVSTSGLPIIILAVGTAYSIHLLNRYYEDSQNSTDKLAIVQRSIKHVGGAIFMAAVTTIAGFSSLATTSLTTIQQFGQFSAVGVIVALLLSLTLTPALLVLWRIPKRNPLVKRSIDGEDGIISGFMRKWSHVVIAYPKPVLLIFLIAIGASLFLMHDIHFEGSIMSNFKKDNVIYQSDKFLNKNLSGTTDINLIFAFRDKINLENPDTQRSLQNHLKRVTASFNQAGFQHKELNEGIILDLNRSFQDISNTLPQSDEKLFAQVKLIQDLLNEEYAVEIESGGNGKASESELETGMVALSGTEEEDLELLSDEPEKMADSLEGDLGDLADDDAGELDGLSENTDFAEGASVGNAAFSDLSTEQIAGLKELNNRLGKQESAWNRTGELVLALRKLKSSAVGVQMQREVNLLNDFLSVDIKQPRVLHKLEKLYADLKNLENPAVIIDGETYKPSGLIVSPVDYVRKFYKVFYHDDNPAYNRLPNVETDGFTDKTLTDRSIIGVVLNQALSADRDGFEAMITPNLKEFQVKAMIRNDSTITIEKYADQAMKLVREQFPQDDPYIASIQTGGGAFTSMQISKLIGTSQLKSIALSFLFVLAVTFFIFRSLTGGLFSLAPLFFTVVLNFGLIALLGTGITMSTMLVASVAIGIGVDYTIHFLERLKIQLRLGDDLSQAYTTTVMTSGKAILINALAVATGFLVFLFSTFQSQIMLGILVAATMALSSLGALTLLPALILQMKPAFLEKARPIIPGSNPDPVQSN